MYKAIENKLDFNSKFFLEKQNIRINTEEGICEIHDSLFEKDYLNICTHGGAEDYAFHADEIICCWMFQFFIPKAHITVVRSRDNSVWDKCDFVFDVGESTLDHHGPRYEPGCSAASRVFQLFYQTPTTYSRLCSERAWEKLGDLIDKVAAFDTGVPGSMNFFPEVHSFEMGARAGYMNLKAAEAFNTAKEAVFHRMNFEIAAIEAAAHAEESALEEMRKGDEIVVFSKNSRLAPVKELLYKEKSPCVFFISPENDRDWRVLCAAPTDQEEFDFRSMKKKIPDKFCGLRGEELNKATGLRDSIFSHAGGFIAGFGSKESAISFAKLCLES